MGEKALKTTEDVLKALSDLLLKAKSNITSTKTTQDLEKERVQYLGRKSPLTVILRGIKNLDEEGKKKVGKEANVIKTTITELLDKQEQELVKSTIAEAASQEVIDVTLPGKERPLGHIHPVTQMLWRAEDIFSEMGFDIVYPNEIDDDYHNFQSLNIPEGHPARDSWDTFWTEDDKIAITHTSSMQNRVLKSKTPPIRAIVPGRCFRNEATDARHEHTFDQVEGIYVDKQVTLADMLGTLKTFFSAFFEQDIAVKFTPDFFPFVEPGGMMSLTCVLCQGKGCDVCKYTGWLEVLGCGMIHPKVLAMAGIDENVYSGFAWGFGLERTMMIKYNIEDIRHFYSGDLRFIRQF